MLKLLENSGLKFVHKDIKLILVCTFQIGTFNFLIFGIDEWTKQDD